MTHTILVIEDDYSIADVIKIVLESEGYKVVVDNTGQTILSDTLEAIPDLVLVDYILPNTNGEIIVNAIKASPKYRNIPIIMMSANTEAELNKVAKRIGADEILPKPFNIDDFISKVKKTLSS